jgi:hypothetical protein
MAQETTKVGVPAHLRPVLQAAANNLLHHLYGPRVRADHLSDDEPMVDFWQRRQDAAPG